METITDLNVLYDAFEASMKGSSWKAEPQKFEHEWLSEITKLKHELEEKTYKTSPGSEFKLNERGKIRHIHGGRVRDRVVRHALCDEILAPSLKPYLIYNNGASQKDKGVDFARKQFERDLHNYWIEHRTNEGYVGFIDFSKFYDNIRHDKVMEMISPHIDSFSTWLLEEILNEFRVDVSYMNDDEYSQCIEDKFDSVRYYDTVPDHMKTGKRFMDKSVDIGDQVSQDIGIFYPTPIDTYATVVRGHRRYGRYMDDSYIIHENREYIKETIEGITRQAEKLGIFINTKKTRIVKLSDTFKYLQIKYFLTETGKVVKRINPKALTRERRKLKAYARLLYKEEISYSAIEQAYKSWMGAYAPIMSKKQIRNIKKLYKELFRKEPQWKQ